MTEDGQQTARHTIFHKLGGHELGGSPILLPRTTQYDINGVNKIGVKDTGNEVTEGRRIVRCNSGTRGITFLLTEENSVATLCQ